MALTVIWESQANRAVLVELNTAWTFQDFQHVIDRAHEMIRTVQHPVDIIMWHKVPLPSRDMMAVFRDAFKKQPTNTGRVIVIPMKWTPMTAFLSRLAEIFKRLYPAKSKILVARTIDEARNLVTQIAPAA